MNNEKEREYKSQIECLICNKNQTVSSLSSSSIITDPESGEEICSRCGMVVLEHSEDFASQEQQAHSMEDSIHYSRTGAPISLAIHEMGLSTVIGRGKRDAKGTILGASTLSTIEKLRTWESRIHTHAHSEKSLRYAFRILEILKNKLGLSETIVEKTAYIFRKACDRQLLRGRTIEGMLAAALFIVCREMGNPKTIKDIATTLDITCKDISRNYSVLVFELDIKMPLVDPMKCVLKIANKIGVSEKAKRKALNIMTEIVEKEISAGKVPMGLAAAVLYISCLKSGEKIPQNVIATASGVTEVTIRNRLKGLTSLK